MLSWVKIPIPARLAVTTLGHSIKKLLCSINKYMKRVWKGSCKIASIFKQKEWVSSDPIGWTGCWILTAFFLGRNVSWASYSNIWICSIASDCLILVNSISMNVGTTLDIFFQFNLTSHVCSSFIQIFFRALQRLDWILNIEDSQSIDSR